MQSLPAILSSDIYVSRLSFGNQNRRDAFWHCCIDICKILASKPSSREFFVGATERNRRGEKRMPAGSEPCSNGQSKYSDVFEATKDRIKRPRLAFVAAECHAAQCSRPILYSPHSSLALLSRARARVRPSRSGRVRTASLTRAHALLVCTTTRAVIPHRAGRCATDASTRAGAESSYALSIT